MRRGTIFWLALLGICSRCGTAAEPGDARPWSLTECNALQTEIYEQRRLLNEVFEELLRDGAETGAWSTADCVVALDAHAEILAPIPAEISSTTDALRRSRAKRASDQPRVHPVATMRATTAIESWFLLHRYHLDGLFGSVTHSQAQAAVQYAETVWLNAKKAGDLTVAVQPLLDARERGVRWPMNAQMRRSSGAPPQHLAVARPSLKADAIYTFDAWAILASPDGLLPPDPATATAGEFARWYDTWVAVRQIGNTFVVRPRIATRILEILARRKEVEARGMDGVHQLIVADAPAAELEDSLKSISHLVGSMQLPGRPSGSTAAPSFGSLRDYRDLLRELNPASQSHPRQLPGVSSEWFAASNLYARWRKAIDGGTADSKAIRSELQKALQHFTPKVAAHIRRQIEVPATAVNDAEEELVPAIPPGQESETLAAALEKLAAAQVRPGEVNAEVTALARAVRGDLSGEVTKGGATQRFDLQWQALAGNPQARRLIPLRDAAIRSHFNKLSIAGSDNPQNPVLLIWREAIAKEAEAGRLEVVARLLDLDRRFSIAPTEEAAEWVKFLTMLQPPADATGIRESLRSQLLRTGNPALMRVIALRLKAAGGG